MSSVVLRVSCSRMSPLLSNNTNISKETAMSKPKTEIKADPIREFADERRAAAAGYKNDKAWKKASADWLDRAFRQKYMYNFSWLGRPIIQLPADMVGFQEVVWNIRPDLIIETGIAHGGSLILSASMLA